VNPWDLRPWELLADQFDVTCIVTRSNVFEVDSVGLPKAEVRALSDLIPPGRMRTGGARAPFNRYLGLTDHLRSADIVHAADLGPWSSVQAAKQKRFGYQLVLTIWETIPFAETLRHPLSRRNRRLSIAATDIFLAATERARQALLLEGASPEKILVSPPGIAVDRFGAGRNDEAREHHLVVSPGRLVWEKGHQDVLRAVAALRGGLLGLDRHDVRALIVGAGPEAARLRAYARELGIEGAVEFRHAVPYDEMPDVYAASSCMVLASLPTRQWEEQFGMVLVEAMSAGLPIVASTSGAIPEVAGDEAAYFAPGDWVGLARALATGALARRPGERVAYSPDRLRRFSAPAAAERIAEAYRRVLL
jgi:glycosyltransferase involved in cell wall biosynthesis